MKVLKRVHLAAIFSLGLVNDTLAGQLQDGANAAKPDDAPPNLFGGTGVFNDIANLLIFVTAAIAVIVLIIGGLRYVISTGDASRVKAAKDTILYGVLGLIVAIFAYAVINFIIVRLT